MAEEQILQANLRSATGSAESKRLRKEGILPGIIYGSGEDATQVQFDEHAFETEMRRHVSEHVMLDVAVGDGKSTKVLLKEVQHHPLTDRIVHVDFQKVSLTDKFKVLVPIEVVGEPIGVTRDGGILELLVREVEVECLPSDIPGQLEIEVSALEIGGHLSLADLVIGSDAVTLSDDPTITVAQVSAPRVVDEDTEETEGEEEESTSTEPEVITERSSDETDDSAD